MLSHFLNNHALNSAHIWKSINHNQIKTGIMKKMIVVVAFLSFLFATQIAQAQPRHRHNQTARQNVRIKEGVRHGSLTRHEARALRHRQADVRHMKKVARSDGRVTPMERHRIHRAERRLDYAIYHKKHNAYRRY